MSDERVVQRLSGHAAVHVVHDRENMAATKQLHQPVYEASLELELQVDIEHRVGGLEEAAEEGEDEGVLTATGCHLGGREGGRGRTGGEGGREGGREGEGGEGGREGERHGWFV